VLANFELTASQARAPMMLSFCVHVGEISELGSQACFGVILVVISFSDYFENQ